MTRSALTAILWIAPLAAASAPASKEPTAPMAPTLSAYVADREKEFDRIPAERKERLGQIAAYIQSCRTAGRPVRLTFICTHNSRRSHLSQIWAQVAAARYGVADVFSYSGGTESTAFNPRAVSAAERAGLLVEKAGDDENPVYLVRYGERARPMACFSKPYHNAPNPKQDFCAVLVCSDADEKCPTVAGAAARVALPFNDPKAFDGKPEESEKYDERCRDIAREMLWIFAAASRD